MIDALDDNLIHRINVGDSLTRSAARNPAALALSDGTRRWNYGQFNTAVNRVANALVARGLASGQALALASANSIEFLVTYYACAKVGLVCVPINLGWADREVIHVLKDSGSVGMVIEAGLLGQFGHAIAEAEVKRVFVIGDPADPVQTAFAELLTHPDDSEPRQLVDDRAPLTYLYTSGTTSAPKGVVGNHTAVYLESMAMCLEGQFRSDDSFCAVMPMFHTAQLNCHCTSAIIVGAAIHIQRGFNATALLDLIEREHITQLFGLPIMYRAMLEHPTIAQRDLTSLRRALYAMAVMPRSLIEQCLKVFNCGFYLLFGQTEMSPATTIFRPEHQLSHSRAGAAGTPMANVHVEIMDEDGNLLPRGETGEIVYRGPQVLTEYLGNAEATDKAFRHGWFHSGDVGHLDADGFLWFTDRSKDVIKTGGENVASIEVEKAILEAGPEVLEVATVGLPHPHWVEAITAFVVPKPGTAVDPDQLRAALRDKLDAYKIPKAIIVVPSLPKTSTGKIRKNVVREQHARHYATTGG
ncbi:MAG TPA: AMP-binding protein [Nevskiaceae bacterium]|nr:AMP-binding protein [Nevskiaceae bacterium]